MKQGLYCITAKSKKVKKMKTRYAIPDKKQRKHEMLLTFLENAQAGKRQQRSQRRKTAPVNIKSMILLLLGTV